MLTPKLQFLVLEELQRLVAHITSTHTAPTQDITNAWLVAVAVEMGRNILDIKAHNQAQPTRVAVVVAGKTLTTLTIVATLAVRVLYSFVTQKHR
jgi:hypothetical protein